MFRTIASALCAALLCSAAARAASEEVRYFPVPEGAGPHDVAPAPDGSVWYTAQGQGALGRLDPETGAVEHVALGEGSAPHGVIVGPDGAAWVTDGGLNAIVRVDPETEAVKTFPLPEGAATPTSTPVPSTRTGGSGSPGRTAYTAGSIRRAARSTFGTRRAVAALTGSRPRRPARSTTPRSPATTSPGSTSRPARLPRSTRRPRIRALAASGRIPKVASGSANGMPARSASSIRQQATGGAGSCPETSPRPTPSMSMKATRSGSPISAPMPSSASIPKRRRSRASRPTVRTLTCVSSTGAPARCGVRSPVPTASW